MRRLTSGLLLGACLAVAGAASAQELEDELVIATTGGLMENSLIRYFYDPFTEATGVDVVPVAIEVPDQWARAEAMARSGAMEFDIVTATPPDMIQHRDILMQLDCDLLSEVVENGVAGACEAYGVMRTVGGMLIAYSTEAFPDEQPVAWADFWDVERFPGPRGLPDTGDRDWWVPVVALLADGVAPDALFPLDLDRAYAKLEEIRPHVAVWWRSGDQVQQAMRTNEVAMTMTYSGRGLATIKEGFPWAMSWYHAVRDTGYMAVMRDAPNPNAALAYLNFFYSDPSNHPDFIRAVSYGSGSATAADLLDPVERAGIATAPENYENLVVADFEWIGENREMLRNRWTEWLTQ